MHGRPVGDGPDRRPRNTDAQRRRAVPDGHVSRRDDDGGPVTSGRTPARAAGTGHGQRFRPEEGSVALYMAIITVALLAMAGLVIDGGSAIAARSKAADLAQQAARAGANALAPDSLRG